MSSSDKAMASCLWLIRYVLLTVLLSPAVLTQLVTELPNNTFVTILPDLFPYCQTASVPTNGVFCPTGLCIYESSLCDRIDDCGDGSDEMQCSDSEDCMKKIPFVDKVIADCPLTTNVKESLPSRLGDTVWLFNNLNVSNSSWISEVTVNTTYYQPDGLYRLNISGLETVVFYVPQDTLGILLTKTLRFPVLFNSSELYISLDRFVREAFMPTSINGSISLTLHSGVCSMASFDCVANLRRAKQFILHTCIEDIGELLYVEIYGQCPLITTCRNDEFTCISRICIPFAYTCDGHNDCGDGSDENLPSCQRNVSTDCSERNNDICLEESQLQRIYTIENYTSFVANESLMIVQMYLALPDDEYLFYGVLRLTITTPRTRRVLYHLSQGFFDVIAYNLRSPLSIQPLDVVTITQEGTEDFLIYPWRSMDTASLEISDLGINKSCTTNQRCIKEVFDIPLEFEHCAWAEESNYLQEWFSHCIEPVEIIYISEDVTILPNSTYTVFCDAKGVPTPTIYWTIEGDPSFSLEMNTQYFDVTPFGNAPVRAVCTASNDDINTVTKMVTVRVLDSRCIDILDEIISFERNECFRKKNISGIGEYEVVFNNIGDGNFSYITEITIPQDGLFQTEGSLTVELRIAKLDFDDRPRRDPGNLIYNSIFENVVAQNRNITISLFPAVFIDSSISDISITVQAINVDMLYFEYTEVFLPLMMTLEVVYACSESPANICDFQEWFSLTQHECFANSYVPAVTSNINILSAVELCYGLTASEPIIIVHPSSTLKVGRYSDINTQCDAENAASVEWFMETIRGDVRTPNSVGNVLSFNGIRYYEQGLYYCVAYGGGQFLDSTAISNPTIVLNEDMNTYLLSMRFIGLEYTADLDNLTSNNFFSVSENITNYFQRSAVQILPGDAELYVDTLRLRPGSVIADIRVFLMNYHNISDVIDYLNYTSEEDVIQPDLSSFKLQVISFCPEAQTNTLAGNLSFPQTTIGSSADSLEMCPSYATSDSISRASRVCFGNFLEASYWEDPVLNNCFEGEAGMNLQNLTEFLEENPVTLENVTEISRDVADITAITTDIEADDLLYIANLLEKITLVESPSPEVTRNVIEVVDNILYLKNDVYTESIEDLVPSSILRSLERQLTNLQMGDSMNFTDIRAGVGAIALQVDQDMLNNPVTFGNFFSSMRVFMDNLTESDTIVAFEAESLRIEDVIAAITLPPSLLNGIRLESEDDVRLTFIIYATSHLFISEATTTLKEVVDSFIVSATVEGQKIENLKDPVITKFYPRPIEGLSDASTRRCVFWNFSLADGAGNWSSEGCEVVVAPTEDGQTLTECHCNHLTNFAVLVDIQGDIDNIVLDILSIIGCVVSVIALLITIITFIGIKKLRQKRPQQILINLCFALLGLYLFYLVGIGQSHLPIGCIIFGALIHYFCLASLAWMCIEATNMYLLFVKVFDVGISRFMWKACLAGWGIPLLVVIVSVAVKSTNYTSTYCFPQADTLTLYLGVLVPIGLMLLYNTVIFTLVIRQLTCARASILKRGPQGRKDMYRRAQNAVAISVLLGLTWIFGFLSIGGAQFFFNLLFLVFNSLQGLFVFLLFCVRQKEVRDIWAEWLCGLCTSQGTLDVDYSKKPTLTTDSASGKRTVGNGSNVDNNSKVDDYESIDLKPAER